MSRERERAIETGLNTKATVTSSMGQVYFLHTFCCVCVCVWSDVAAVVIIIIRTLPRALQLFLFIIFIWPLFNKTHLMLTTLYCGRLYDTFSLFFCFCCWFFYVCCMAQSADSRECNEWDSNMCKRKTTTTNAKRKKKMKLALINRIDL